MEIQYGRLKLELRDRVTKKSNACRVDETGLKRAYNELSFSGGLCCSIHWSLCTVSTDDRLEAKTYVLCTIFSFQSRGDVCDLTVVDENKPLFRRPPNMWDTLPVGLLFGTIPATRLHQDINKKHSVVTIAFR